MAELEERMAGEQGFRRLLDEPISRAGACLRIGSLARMVQLYQRQQAVSTFKVESQGCHAAMLVDRRAADRLDRSTGRTQARAGLQMMTDSKTVGPVSEW